MFEIIVIALLCVISFATVFIQITQHDHEKKLTSISDALGHVMYLDQVLKDTNDAVELMKKELEKEEPELMAELVAENLKRLKKEEKEPVIKETEFSV